ncbi:MAG: AtpZ/AtpI family protein [Chitinophagaceae bacterium]|nr:AtpZ/AtpI family protein [Chitinophagaceae bacterium]
MRNPNSYMKYAGMASQWIVMLGLAVWGGLKADRYFRFRFPWFTITLPMAALVAMLYQVYRDSNSPTNKK